MLWIQEQNQPFPERLDGSGMRIARQAQAPVIAPPLGWGMAAHKGARVAKGRSQRAAAGGSAAFHAASLVVIACGPKASSSGWQAGRKGAVMEGSRSGRRARGLLAFAELVFDERQQRLHGFLLAFAAGLQGDGRAHAGGQQAIIRIEP